MDNVRRVGSGASVIPQEIDTYKLIIYDCF